MRGGGTNGDKYRKCACVTWHRITLGVDLNDPFSFSAYKEPPPPNYEYASGAQRPFREREREVLGALSSLISDFKVINS